MKKSQTPPHPAHHPIHQTHQTPPKMSKNHIFSSSSLPILLSLVAIFFIYTTTTFIFIHGWLNLFSSPGLINAAAFTVIATMCVWNYVVAVRTDPGRVPGSFVPDVEDGGNPVHEIKRKGGDLRYCQKCSHYKPPRAHHCRACKRCVLRMDHHCIWINNCVGHANYKVFFIFVLYATIACIYSLVLFLGSIINDFLKNDQESEESSRTLHVNIFFWFQPSTLYYFLTLGANMRFGTGTYESFAQVIFAVLVIPLTIALAVLFGWHVYLMLGNKTTIEYYEGVRALWLAEKGGDVYLHPYDLGPFENLTAVLGPNIISWSNRLHIRGGNDKLSVYAVAVRISRMLLLLIVETEVYSCDCCFLQRSAGILLM
ncbi:putative protein S-acyltransferase 16 [Drosera capensis]